MKTFLITLAGAALLLTTAHAQTAPASTLAPRHAEEEGQPVYYNDGTALVFGPAASWPAGSAAPATSRRRRALLVLAETPHPTKAPHGDWLTEAEPQPTAATGTRP